MSEANYGIDPEELFKTEYKPAGYQKCPVCKGSGQKFEYADSGGNHYKNCHVCDGRGIINRSTGKPPTEV